MRLRRGDSSFPRKLFGSSSPLCAEGKRTRYCRLASIAIVLKALRSDSPQLEQSISWLSPFEMYSGRAPKTVDVFGASYRCVQALRMNNESIAAGRHIVVECLMAVSYILPALIANLSRPSKLKRNLTRCGWDMLSAESRSQ